MSRRKLLTDDEVLDAALPVIFRKGPADFTLSDVAAVVGLAPATLVQRFGAKRDLIVRAVARDNIKFFRALDGAPRDRSAEAVIDLFWGMTPGYSDEDALAAQLLWLRQDMSDPALGALARERFEGLRAAIAQRLPPLPIAGDTAARLIEAQWQGALSQWGLHRRGPLLDYVAESLAAWFELVTDRHEP